MRVTNVSERNIGLVVISNLRNENVKSKGIWHPNFARNEGDFLESDSIKLSFYEKEFLRFSDKTIDWSNKKRKTPDGTYLLYLPNAYYDSKNGEYINLYTLVNEYQKNVFKQNKNNYPVGSYYTKDIPKDYKMKKVFGIVTVIKPEEEALIRQKNCNVVLTTAAMLATTMGLGVFAAHKLLKYAKTVK